MQNFVEAPEVTKKKPGRPKKKVTLVYDKCVGIVGTPVIAGNHVELVYKDSFLFRKIVSLMHSYNISDIEILFDSTQVIFEGLDRFKRNKIIAIIDAKEMNQYYCKAPVRICVRCETLDKILNTAVKVSTVHFFLRDDSTRSTLFCYLTDTAYSANNVFELEIILRKEQQQSRVYDDTNYPLKFSFDSKHFKILCTNMAKFSDQFSVQHIGGGRVQFKFGQTRQNEGIASYEDDSKISLVSTLAHGDVLSVTMCIGAIEPLSKACLGNDVFIAVDKQLPMSITSNMVAEDGSKIAVVKMYTEMKDFTATTS